MVNFCSLDIEQRLTEIETLDLLEIKSSTVLKLSPVVKRWRVKGGQFWDVWNVSASAINQWRTFSTRRKTVPHAQIYDSGQNFRGDNLFRDTDPCP